MPRGHLSCVKRASGRLFVRRTAYPEDAYIADKIVHGNARRYAVEADRQVHHAVERLGDGIDGLEALGQRRVALYYLAHKRVFHRSVELHTLDRNRGSILPDYFLIYTT